MPEPRTNEAVVHREIGIDCGHRVPDHASKCRSPHGHRYRIIVTCAGPILEEDGGAEHGMVIDFGNIKRVMMDVLDAVFDHAFVVSVHDDVMMDMFFPGKVPVAICEKYDALLAEQLARYAHQLSSGYPHPVSLPRTRKSVQDPDGMKVVPVFYTPTAENMARHMYEMVSTVLHKYHRDTGLRVANLRLYETPNGWVDYRPDGLRMMVGVDL